MEAHVENRVGEHAQHFFLKRQAQLGSVVEVTFIEHHLLRVHRPAFDVRTAAPNASEHPAVFRLDIVGKFKLHIMAGHSLVDCEQL